MKRLMRVLVTTWILAALLCAMVTPAFAYGEIIYTGLESDVLIRSESWSDMQYTDTDLFGNFKDVMPGDSLFETINFVNDAEDNDYINLYMKFIAHDEVDNVPQYSGNETVASMNDFLSQLTMRVYNGEELVYEGPASGQPARAMRSM